MACANWSMNKKDASGAAWEKILSSSWVRDVLIVASNQARLSRELDASVLFSCIPATPAMRVSQGKDCQGNNAWNKSNWHGTSVPCALAGKGWRWLECPASNAAWAANCVRFLSISIAQWVCNLRNTKWNKTPHWPNEHSLKIFESGFTFEPLSITCRKSKAT